MKTWPLLKLLVGKKKTVIYIIFNSYQKERESVPKKYNIQSLPWGRGCYWNGDKLVGLQLIVTGSPYFELWKMDIMSYRMRDKLKEFRIIFWW